MLLPPYNLSVPPCGLVRHCALLCTSHHSLSLALFTLIPHFNHSHPHSPIHSHPSPSFLTLSFTPPLTTLHFTPHSLFHPSPLTTSHSSIPSHPLQAPCRLMLLENCVPSQTQRLGSYPTNTGVTLPPPPVAEHPSPLLAEYCMVARCTHILHRTRGCVVAFKRNIQGSNELSSKNCCA